MAQLIGTSLNLSFDRYERGYVPVAEVILLLSHVDYALESESEGHTVTMGRGGVKKVLRPEVIRFKADKTVLEALIDDVKEILDKVEAMAVEGEKGIVLLNQ